MGQGGCLRQTVLMQLTKHRALLLNEDPSLRDGAFKYTCEYGDGATLPPLCSYADIQGPGLRKSTLRNSRNLKIQNISMTL